MRRNLLRATTLWSLAMVCALFLLAALPARAAGPGWLTSWAAAPLPPSAMFAGTITLNNQTVRQVVRLSAGGTSVRIRISNEYGTKPLTVGAASLAPVAAGSTGAPVTNRKLTFNGSPGIIVPVGAPVLSDPVDLKVAALDALSIRLYFPEDTGPCVCHEAGLQEGAVSAAGDFTAGNFVPASTLTSRVFLSAVEVAATGSTIVVLGDSISDGVGSTMNANRRWPDLLAARLAARGGTHWAVANLGISGNRLLENGAGDSALARFDRDVLGNSGVTHLIVFEGVNDLGMSYGSFPGAQRRRPVAPSPPASAPRLIAGYRQLIERAHARGIKVIGATIAPYEGAVYYSVEGEAQRQAVNRWIRTGGGFDAVLDFDAVLRDPEHPARIAEGLHAGDHLHGSDAGYARLAESIDLGVFQ